ncbi:hypothetical protein HID58_041452 [Brassica napus]|uniref:S-acyltransferase n=1 Tax=Brassica napus TaxID=3708 RepID=A0ABQ8BAW2_BRANA|nr:hypothetical protein HID58_041452 [Brassica napus]
MLQVQTNSQSMIPYPTVQDASVALGRNLTLFETVWFDYSATKSDFHVYCHTILVLFLVFSLAPLPFVFVELTGWFERFKIQPKVKYSLSDMFLCYKEVMKLFLRVVGTLQFVTYPSIQMAGIRSGLPLPSLMEIVAQLVVYFLIEDYTNYWIHRWLHCKWGYEKIHRVHHEYTSPIGYASPYAHWAEVLLLGIPTFLGPAIAPGHIMTFWLWISLRQMEAIETHSGYDLPWTLTKMVPFYGGAEYHDYHHYFLLIATISMELTKLRRKLIRREEGNMIRPRDKHGLSVREKGIQRKLSSVFPARFSTQISQSFELEIPSSRAMAWNVFKYCTALRALGSIMILVVIGIIGFTYYALVVANYGPSLFLGGFDSLLALLVLALFHFLLIMLLWSYFSVVVTDPGGVPPGWRPELDIEKSDGNQEYSSLTVGDSSSHIVRYCRKCNQYKPPRSHHCSVCGRCILKMDHHCVWVVNCVGAKNYKSFLLFLFYTFLETTVVAISLFPVFLVFFTDGDSDVTVSPGSLAATFVAFVLNITFALSVLGFLIMHIMLVIRNTTTIEAYEKHTAPNSPYNLGRKQNFEQVFGKDKLYWFVPLYTEDDM